MSSELLDRLPPHNIDAERGVIGSLLIDPGFCQEIAAILKAEDFYVDAHARIYRNIIELYDESGAIDSTLLLERLRQSGELEGVGGVAVLAEIIQSVAVAAHAVYYAHIVREKAARRRLVLSSMEVLKSAYDDEVDVRDILAVSENAMQAVHVQGAQKPTVPAYDAMVKAWELMKMRQRGDLPLLTTGLSVIDNKYGGLFNGELIILAARPSVGKTSLATQIAVHAAVNKQRTLFVSLEMQPDELMSRVLASRAGIALGNIRKGLVTPEEESRFIETAGSLKDMALDVMRYNDTDGLLRVRDIRRVARAINKQTDALSLSLIVVDYLQLLDAENPTLPRQEQVAVQSRALKRLAQELNIPVLCLAQLNRLIERDKKRRPMLSDLRESGSLEQDADVVMFLHRPEIGDDRNADVVELVVAKCRNNEPGVYKLLFDGSSTTFRVQAPSRFSEFDNWSE